jgi:hypothetical protein
VEVFLAISRITAGRSGVHETHLEVIWAAGPPEAEILAQIYQGDLAQIGFGVVLKPLERAVLSGLLD